MSAEVSYRPLRFGFEPEEETGECEFCDAVIEAGTIGVGHRDVCPFVTGFWTLTEEEALSECANPECDHLVGVVCPRCFEPIDAGDVYRIVDLATGMLAPCPAAGDVICLECAERQAEALAELLEWAAR